MVICDEPASLTDAYALIKVFSQNYGISRFSVLTNQSRKQQDGRKLFRKLVKVADNFLDVVLRHIGDIPHDEYLVKAVQEQRAVVDAYPNSKAGLAFQEVARAIDSLAPARGTHGGIQFFFERLLNADLDMRGKVA